ncbi:MAG TPA: gliding motility-associated C-terminal domain-containing protein [Solirubrobacter sp.]|nr:gliding motility-associated C-terminal domain-containing protein [Solirubrobacter sp.]
MTRAAQLLVLVLIGTTLAALVVQQTRKDEPPIVGRVLLASAFSPNGDGFHDRAKIRFRLEQPDRVTLTVVDRHGRRVRELLHDRRIRAHRVVRFYWDGRTDAARRAPPGVYRVRMALARRGWSHLLVRDVRLSARPPRR